MSAKKKILLVGDMPGWAFDNIISFIKEQLKKEYDFYYDFTVYNPRKSSTGLSDSTGTTDTSLIDDHFRKMYFRSSIPLINSLSYKIVSYLNKWGILERDAEGKKRRIRVDNTYDCVVFLDFYMDIDGDFDHLTARRVVKGIYTDGYPPKGIKLEAQSIESFLKNYYHNAAALLAGSKSISEIYRPHTKLDIYTANMAYDELIFKPRNKSSKRVDNKLILGWTGNPNRSFKGFHEIILPVVNELQKEGLNIELRTQFSGTLNSLADFWQEIDLAIIMSEADAGPSLFMEASLCGVPSISTNIGMPTEVIINDFNGKLIERNSEALKIAIKNIYFEPNILNLWRQNIRGAYINKLGCQVQKNNWKNLFNGILNE